MNSEEEKQLLVYLEFLGFKGEAFAKEVHEKQERDAPVFNVTYRKNFGEEQMIYDLRLKRDMQFNAYRLEEYTATHKAIVKIDHQVINGIDTEKLEAQMKEVDWDKYFKMGRLIFQEQDKEKGKLAGSIMDMLAKLEGDNNANGWHIQQQLMYKYWPEDSYDASSMPFKHELEHRRSFAAHEAGICNTNLAYHILSGRLDDLYEMLNTTDMSKYPGIDLYRELEKILSSDPDQFELRFNRSEREGYAEYILPVSKVDGWHSPDTYTIILTLHPPIEHGKYAGIDTARLEQLMQQIDWHDHTQHFKIHDDEEPEFFPKVAEVQEQIHRLSQDMAGSDIADRLMLKYWSDSEIFFEDMVPQSAWTLLDELPKRIQEFPVEMNMQAAYNLLCGRAVLQSNIDALTKESHGWTRLIFTGEGEANGNYKTEVIKGYNAEELENTLRMLPVVNIGPYALIDQLQKGSLVPAAVKKTGKHILLEANPEDRTINIYTPDMQPIQSNIYLEPDWKPANTNPLKPDLEKEKLESNNKKNRPNKPHRKGKGRRL